MPDLLVFEERLQTRCDAGQYLLFALAAVGLGEKATARTAFDHVFAFTLAQPEALEL